MIAQDWRNASREPVGLAPNPFVVREAVIQVYGARAVGAKGLFQVMPGAQWLELLYKNIFPTATSTWSGTWAGIPTAAAGRGRREGLPRP